MSSKEQSASYDCLYFVHPQRLGGAVMGCRLQIDVQNEQLTWLQFEIKRAGAYELLNL